MKKRFRFLSLILTCVILLSVIPLGGISSSAEAAADILLNDFDEVSDASSLIFSADLNVQVTAALDTENKYTASGKSVKITTVPATSAGYRRARLTVISASDSSALGFKLWIKNPSQSGISIAVQFIDKSGNWINMKSNRAYYTENMLGEVSQHMYRKKADGTDEGCIYLEAGFEGFVYLPFKSGYSTLKADNVSIIALSAYTQPDSPVTYYVDELSSYTDMDTDNMIIRRFSEYETEAQMKANMYISGSQSVTLDTENDACVIDTGTSGKTSGMSFQFAANDAYNDHTGMKVRVKAGGEADTDILFKWESNQHRPLKSGALYYLVDSAGNIYSKKASADNTAALITLPAGFDGWIYVPFSSAYPMTYSQIYRLYLNAVIEHSAGRSLSVYEISLYKDLPIVSGAAFVINDFEGYSSTQNLKDSLVYGNTTALTLSLNQNAWGSKGLKFSQDSEGINGSFAVGFGASSMTSSFTGFKVRITANKNSNILIKSEDAQHRPMKPQSLYYLVSSDGRAYSYKTSTDQASLVQLTAGFDGWIYIPFSSLYDINLSKACRLWFLPDSTNEAGSEFTVDDIVFYSGNPEVINDTPIEFKRVLPYNPDNTILDFDSCSTTEEMTKKIKIHSASGVDAALDSTAAQNKNSCKFTFAEGGGSIQTIVEFKKNSYFSEITGFRFWVKASEANESVSLLYKLETSEHRPIKRGAAYYLADVNGKVSKRSASLDNDAALISLPAGYEGWVYVPMSSIYPMNIEDLYRIWFVLKASESASKNIWLDNIECYTDNPTPTNTDIINDFDYYSGTADILLDSAFQAQTEGDNFSIESTYRDGTAGKSLKIKTVKGSYKFNFSSDGKSEYDGFNFYVKNPSDKAVYLLPQTDSSGRDSFIPGKAYYLESKTTGAVEMYKFGKIVADAGNIEIPAGFEGYVYLPYSSAYPSLQNNINKVNAFWLTIPNAIVTDSQVYIDTVAFYKNSTCRISSILVWKQDTVGMLYGFEKSNSVTGYRGWISADEGLDVDISKTYSHSGTNSLKISTPVTSADEAKNKWAVTTLSLKNEDGTYNDMSMYDGIAFWIKVERDGTDTKTVEDKVGLGFKVNMPSHGRLYTTSPIYIFKDGDTSTEPDVFTNVADGCSIVTLSPGFSGMIYIPFSTLEGFGEELDVTTKLTDVFVMFRLHSLIGYNVYIDDIQGYNMKDLYNVNWPGDADYDPLNDPMLKAVAHSDNSGKVSVNKKTDIDTESGIGAMPIALGCVGAVIIAAGIAVFIILKKKKSKKA